MDHSLMSADEAAVAVAEKMSLGKSDAMPKDQEEAEGGLTEPEKKNKKLDVVGKSDDQDEDDAGEEEGEEEEGEEEEEEEEDLKKKTKKAQKSLLAEEDLMKALDVLDRAAVHGPSDRRAELADRVAKGTIEKSERDELIKLLGEEPEMEKSFSESFANDEQLQSDYEISPFIERHSQLVAEGLDSLRLTIAKSVDGQGQFNSALAKSLRGIGEAVIEQSEMIKSQQEKIKQLQGRLDAVERSPLPRRSIGSVAGVAGLKKSFDGEQDGALSKSQITNGLLKLMEKSRSSNFIAPCGEQMDLAISRFETEGKISKSLLADVENELRK